MACCCPLRLDRGGEADPTGKHQVPRGLGAPAVLGEMAVLEPGGKRTASALAVTPVELAFLSGAELRPRWPAESRRSAEARRRHRSRAGPPAQRRECPAGAASQTAAPHIEQLRGVPARARAPWAPMARNRARVVSEQGVDLADPEHVAGHRLGPSPGEGLDRDAAEQRQLRTAADHSRG